MYPEMPGGQGLAARYLAVNGMPGPMSQRLATSAVSPPQHVPARYLAAIPGHGPVMWQRPPSPATLRRGGASQDQVQDRAPPGDHAGSAPAGGHSGSTGGSFKSNGPLASPNASRPAVPHGQASPVPRNNHGVRAPHPSGEDSPPLAEPAARPAAAGRAVSSLRGVFEKAARDSDLSAAPRTGEGEGGASGGG